MKKVLVALVFLGTLISCNSTKTELEQFQSNQEIVAKEFPNYHITTFRTFNYIFHVSNREHLIELTIGKNGEIKKDTLKTFSSYAKN